MKRIVATVLAAILLSAFAPAGAQTNVRIRGTIAAVDHATLTIKSRTGEDLRLKLADDMSVVAARALQLADLKPGDYVGVTAIRGADGLPHAREVHTIARTVPEGHGPWTHCSTCGGRLDEVLRNSGYHIGCGPPPPLRPPGWLSAAEKRARDLEAEDTLF